MTDFDIVHAQDICCGLLVSLRSSISAEKVVSAGQGKSCVGIGDGALYAAIVSSYLCQMLINRQSCQIQRTGLVFGAVWGPASPYCGRLVKL